MVVAGKSVSVAETIIRRGDMICEEGSWSAMFQLPYSSCSSTLHRRGRMKKVWESALVLVCCRAALVPNLDGQSIPNRFKLIGTYSVFESFEDNAARE